MLPDPPKDRTGFPWTSGTRDICNSLPRVRSYPKITIVTPSYKQGHYIEETIRSVLLQDYPNLEYIVIDGGSPDNTVEILSRYASFLTYWVSEPDKGQAHAINKGFSRATGEIMGWLNSDDVLLPGALHHIAQAFLQNPEHGFVTGLRKRINERSEVTDNFIQDRPTNFYIRHYCCVAQETTYWRRTAWNELGPLNETFQFAMDYEYWLRAVQQGYELKLIPQYLGAYRDYVNNKTNSWLGVYHKDMQRLYHQYKMGESEAEIHARLGKTWARRYGFYLAMGKRDWTNSPRLVVLMWYLFEIPRVFEAIGVAWRVKAHYRSLRVNNGFPIWIALLVIVVSGFRSVLRLNKNSGNT
jgi:glycosyltransferase involved in cell wall biosynthesis